MIDEMMPVFDSPGIVSKFFIIALLSRDPTTTQGADTGRSNNGMCRAGFLRSRALRTGWLRSPSRPRSAYRLAWTL